MKRTYCRPVLPRSAGVLSDAKRRLYGGRKIVVAGVTRRLEAAWDDDGLALGVQVYAAANPADDPHFLLALLNSKLLSHLFRVRFQAKRLASGYLAINKGQLERLPIRVIDAEDHSGQVLRGELAQLARRMQQLHGRRRRAESGDLAARWMREIRAADRQIDRLVYRLYELTDDEIANVEAAIDGL
jgi:hypothetical protein